MLTGRIRRLWSPAAREERRRSFTRSGRTSGWAWEAEGMVGAGSSMASSGGRRSGYGGEAAPVDNRGRGVAGQVREGKAKLMVGSVWAQESCSGWSTMSFGSPACRWTAAAFWGLGAGKRRGSEGNGMRTFS